MVLALKIGYWAALMKWQIRGEWLINEFLFDSCSLRSLRAFGLGSEIDAEQVEEQNGVVEELTEALQKVVNITETTTKEVRLANQPTHLIFIVVELCALDLKRFQFKRLQTRARCMGFELFLEWNHPCLLGMTGWGARTWTTAVGCCAFFPLALLLTLRALQYLLLQPSALCVSTLLWF